ncbi:hypothetical protein [Paraglaciecola chathamensis]|jgi:hypothetical protein|uniref:Uncharacterized protein n=2 Tax=Paraglaciecola chathamensis TaxID=368405 RepID=A0A8H9M2G5_9ALTE|nr:MULTISPECIES: hypothetical protein [Paraglaciecola]AEE21942.1 hypothetical protein Glaag_0981 [Glaciecola sp. 4H-3-7+YE-5]GAC03657.1 hypothetical protein GAGA_0794 [Paraglaciecola agarilytica NO2]GGZ47119.1 hypothetical protein GCM10011274_00920 [Paraglaciecola oceanifecundans]
MANIQVKKPADLAKAGLAKLAAFFALTFFMLTITFPSQAAFCSLRDPISAIQALYSQEYQFRTVVTDVTEADREQMKQQLPFTIHQSEVAKHTLYVLYKDQKAEGFLQARSEWAKWGLVEIAWAINLDRTLKGFYFQRCRSPQCNDTVTRSISHVIQGKSFSQLKSLLSDDGETLSAYGQSVFPIAPRLALLTLRSALKTLAITDISWRKDLQNLAIAH